MSLLVESFKAFYFVLSLEGWMTFVGCTFLATGASDQLLKAKIWKFPACRQVIDEEYDQQFYLTCG
jgi:hypothetical protein